MNARLFLIVGLAFNTLGALTLLVPNLNPWKHVSNEEIIGAKDDEGKYIQTKDLKNMVSSVVGFILLTVGFILQLIGILAT